MATTVSPVENKDVSFLWIKHHNQSEEPSDHPSTFTAMRRPPDAERPVPLHLSPFTPSPSHLSTFTPSPSHLSTFTPSPSHLSTFTPSPSHLSTFTPSPLHLSPFTPSPFTCNHSPHHHSPVTIHRHHSPSREMASHGDCPRTISSPLEIVTT